MGDESTDETLIIADIPAHSAAGVNRRAYVVIVAGSGVGEVFALDKPRTVGRGYDADVRIQDSGISRRHARFAPADGRVVIEDLGSTNGTFVNGVRIAGRHVLADGDKLQFGTFTVLRFEYRDEADEAFQRWMFESASRDGLTGAYNARYFRERMNTTLADAPRGVEDVSLILFDIDHFKAVNDTHGHLAGDRVLSGVASVVAALLQHDDVFARYGGEEFAVLARGSAAQAAQLAERLRAAVEARTFEIEGLRIRVTISVGVASLSHQHAGPPTALVAAADRALYRAKDGGRNRVEVGDTDEQTQAR
jgi:two-component system cell cycle response regulator